MTQNPQQMYNDLRRLWLSTADEDSIDEASAEFDAFISSLLKQGRSGDVDTTAAQADEGVSQSRMLMEIILEVDTTMRMVPPRVKTYRDLLAAQGLDKTSDVGSDHGGQKGMAGINLADQAALEFHRAMLGLAVSVAQAEAADRMLKAQRDAGTLGG